MISSKRTRDHEEIRRWAASRGARPAAVKGTASRRSDVGLLRFDFNDPDDHLQEISWDAFFKKFDESRLALLYQETTSDGAPSRFFKFVMA